MTNTTAPTANPTRSTADPGPALHRVGRRALAGRTALVTGAGTGIGAATAAALATAGARVVLTGRRADRLQAVTERLTAELADAGTEVPELVAVTADVTDAAALTMALDRARDQLGAGFDLVSANAGSMFAAPFASADPGEWQRMLDTNVLGLLNTARATTDDLMAAGARGGPADLVLVSSIGARVAMPGYAVYFASKAAVSHLATNLHIEFGPRGVRVHSIEPGMTKSDLGQDMSDEASRQALADFAVAVPPMPASAIADAITFAVAQPPVVTISSMVVLPTHQI
ncbi:SDR family oxidoreductase [Nakamurella aerolata]|uniref:SDR family NAD(P)-dependent oxidoreductase n=1 Tax=Nakamurella aerolata TaxID=1656892 RepID=A0A849A3W2_9ACTN|nr:SDR family NAD(P)-dependent oxidoreductase [Nakamurella aerolata]NNG35704.1 SDR family NAD(P)-dependent oxidoreductase [Nakamurella aerolata]